MSDTDDAPTDRDGPLNGDDENASADDEKSGVLSGPRRRLGEGANRLRTWMGTLPRWKADALVILTALFLVYALFVVLTWGQGLDTNGMVSSLARLTFLAAAYALLVLALNLHWGYAGLFNIGVAGFMSIAVFTLAIVSGEAGVGFGLPIWVGMIAGMVVAAGLGLVAAIPALRLRADYFAIVTLGIAEIVRRVMKSDWLQDHRLFGREVGLDGGAPVVVPSAKEYVYKLFTEGGGARDDPTLFGAQFFAIGEWFGVERTTVMAWAYALVLVVAVVLVYLLLSRLAYSPFGRVLKAIREDEDAARALGKPTGRFKIYSFVLGCALMGLAGMLWQASRFQVGPDAFMPYLTFYVFVALIVGGSGSNAGSVVGGIAFVGLLLEGPRQLQRVVNEHVSPPESSTVYDGVAALGQFDPMPLLGYAITNIDQLQRVFMGIVLILLMLKRPEGILGYRKEIAAATDLSRPGGETDE